MATATIAAVRKRRDLLNDAVAAAAGGARRAVLEADVGGEVAGVAGAAGDAVTARLPGQRAGSTRRRRRRALADSGGRADGDHAIETRAAVARRGADPVRSHTGR